ncbi:MAG: MerR family transcriptional regulator [Firmicutes bacterium]|nr:MerR family transcriptional regulator [Bacillota bacterium]
MEYTVQKLGRMAGISTRTLRYYDEIGLLKPARINSSGYRIYGAKEVDRLQQIMFYRELDVCLQDIKAIVTNPSFDGVKALQGHLGELLIKREQIDAIIANVRKTLASTEGRMTMLDKEKFTGLKKKMVDENEQKYGKEIREKYGIDAVEHSNKAFKNMSQENFERMNNLAEKIHVVLAEAIATADPASQVAQKAADLHKQWITLAWGHYDKEAHAGLAQMYVDDARFTAYYDKKLPGTAALLRDAIYIMTGTEK